MRRSNKTNKEVATAIKEVKKSTRKENETKTAPRKRVKKDVVELIQQDGKLHNKYGVSSIDELLGETDSKYSTSNIKEYEAMLEDMNTSDLQRHAVSLQIIPKEDRRLLTKILLKQFEINNSSKLNRAKKIPQVQKRINQDVLDILAEGR